jgi:hypothetical protein
MFPGERIRSHAPSDVPTVVLKPLTHGCVDLVRDRLTNFISRRKQLEVADALLHLARNLAASPECARVSPGVGPAARTIES